MSIEGRSPSHAGDPRDSLCIYCGRQVNGKPLDGGFIAFPYHQGPKPARKRPRYRSAP